MSSKAKGRGEIRVWNREIGCKPLAFVRGPRIENQARKKIL